MSRKQSKRARFYAARRRGRFIRRINRSIVWRYERFGGSAWDCVWFDEALGLIRESLGINAVLRQN